MLKVKIHLTVLQFAEFEKSESGEKPKEERFSSRLPLSKREK